LLVPDNWPEYSNSQKASYIKEDFRFASWSAEELERFEMITFLFQKNYQIFYQRVGTKLDTMEFKADDSFRAITAMMKKILLEMADLKHHVDKRDTMIDSNYFCGETGYTMGSFNNQTKIYETGPVEKAHVLLGVYRTLVWTRPKGTKKWKCPLMEFDKLRSGFTYEMQVEEKKRKGEFKEPLKINILDIV